MKKKLTLKIGHLYGNLMNTYGDNGNIQVLKKRCQWRGIEVEAENIEVGQKIKKGQFDLYFFGGGQDQAQELISKDLTSGNEQSSSSNKDALKAEVERGVPVLAICGGYQLLGDYYQPQNGPKLPGLGIFPVHTTASNQRMIGNLVIKTENFGDLVGFENHAGQTFLKEKGETLGKVIKGFGNNGEDQTEGCIYNNAIGCYMHGSLLPKNPQLADWLISKALEIKYGKKIDLEPLDDTLEEKAHTAAIQKFS